MRRATASLFAQTDVPSAHQLATKRPTGARYTSFQSARTNRTKEKTTP
jgi:hypothetical protein